jgi:hypothetical protein
MAKNESLNRRGRQRTRRILNPLSANSATSALIYSREKVNLNEIKEGSVAIAAENMPSPLRNF